MNTAPQRPAPPVLLLMISLVLSGVASCSKKSGVRSSGTDAAQGSAVPKTSDLDETVGRLMSRVCEHGIPQYTCPECRYQVGVVKADRSLFEPAAGGLLELAVVAPRSLAGGRELTGEVRLNEERAVFVGPRAPGVVRSIRVDVGDRVADGQLLFEVESPDFRQARADLVRVTAAAGLAEATAARERDLFERRICPQKDLLEAEAALAQSRAERKAVVGRLLGMGLSEREIGEIRDASSEGLMPVRAPFPGTVLERSLSLGALALPSDKLLLLADTATVWIITMIREREVAALLAAGAGGEADAEVTVSAYPDRLFRGRVQKVGGTLDEATRTAKARVVVRNPGNLLRAGMFARVRLLLKQAAAPLAVPSEAVLEDEGRSFVFVRVREPFFIRRPVTAGLVEAGWTEVSGDVRVGDTVVSKGAFLLKSDVLRSKMGAGCAD